MERSPCNERDILLRPVDAGSFVFYTSDFNLNFQTRETEAVSEKHLHLLRSARTLRESNICAQAAKEISLAEQPQEEGTWRRVARTRQTSSQFVPLTRSFRMRLCPLTSFHPYHVRQLGNSSVRAGKAEAVSVCFQVDLIGVHQGWGWSNASVYGFQRQR